MSSCLSMFSVLFAFSLFELFCGFGFWSVMSLDFVVFLRFCCMFRGFMIFVFFYGVWVL